MATNDNIVPGTRVEHNETVKNGNTNTNNANANSDRNRYHGGPAAGSPDSTKRSVVGDVNLSMMNTNGQWNHGWQGYGPYGGNPLAQINTDTSLLPAFGGNFQPGLYKERKTTIGNPAPLGLSAFAFTTFLLSLLNWRTRNVVEPNITIGAAFAYGGIIQICSGMWEMAIGNTFAATAITSYGGFWISFAIILTPGGFEIAEAYENPVHFNWALGFYLAGWFIFSFMIWICTFKSTLMFSALFFFVEMIFLLLSLSYLATPDVVGGGQHVGLQKAGGMCGLLAAFIGWWIALAGLLDHSNSFFLIPVCHFPWSEKGRQSRQEKDEEKAANSP